MRRLANLRVACRCLEKAGATTPDGTGRVAVVQENHPDPWGLSLPLDVPPVGTGSSPSERYKFTGKEELAETGYIDFGARQYDPQAPRFTTLDMLSELTPELTGYRYGFNNPLRFSDFMGLWETDKNGNSKTSSQEDIARFLTYVQAQSASGNNTTQGEIDRFISFESEGGGNSYALRGGATLLFDGPTIKGSLQNDKWKTSSIDMSSLSEFTNPHQKTFDDWGKGSSYAAFVSDPLEEIFNTNNGRWLGKNGKWYSQSWGGNGYTGGRLVNVAKDAKAFKYAKSLGRGILAVDVVMNLAELYDNGFSNRGWAKVAFAVGMVAIAATGPVGLAISLGLSVVEANGGFDKIYENFTNDPRFGMTNSNLPK